MESRELPGVGQIEYDTIASGLVLAKVWESSQPSCYSDEQTIFVGLRSYSPGIIFFFFFFANMNRGTGKCWFGAEHVMELAEE